MFLYENSVLYKDDYNGAVGSSVRCAAYFHPGPRCVYPIYRGRYLATALSGRPVYSCRKPLPCKILRQTVQKKNRYSYEKYLLGTDYGFPSMATRYYEDSLPTSECLSDRPYRQAAGNFVPQRTYRPEQLELENIVYYIYNTLYK